MSEAAADVPFEKRKVCCCEMKTFLTIVNCCCGIAMIVFGVFNMFSWVGGGRQILMQFGFFIYQILFGLLITISFCSFKWIEENFYFLKTTSGRGWFDILCSSMPLISNDGVSGFVMMGLLLGCGIFFVVLACCTK